MANPVWGLLAKSQDDAEKIEEAISRLIAEHEADPNAHLGVGESLETHRATDILDHVPGCVLADKWTMSEFDFTTLFENLGRFFLVGSYDNYWPGVGLYSEGSGAIKKSSIEADLESNGFNFDTSKEMLMQISLYTDISSDCKVAVFLGRTYSDEYLRGMGVEIVGNTARFYLGKTDGTSPVYLTWPGFEQGVNYIVRIHNVPSQNKVNFYVNGSLIGYLVWPAQWSYGCGWKGYIYDTTGGSNTLMIRSLYLSFSP